MSNFEFPNWISNTNFFKNLDLEDNILDIIPSEFLDFNIPKTKEEYIIFCKMLDFWGVINIPFEFFDIVRSEKYDADLKDNNFINDLLIYIKLNPYDLVDYSIENNLPHIYQYTFELKKKLDYYEPGFTKILDIEFIIIKFSKPVKLDDNDLNIPKKVFLYGGPFLENIKNVYLNYTNNNNELDSYITDIELFQKFKDKFKDLTGYIILENNSVQKLNVQDFYNVTRFYNFSETYQDKLKYVRYYKDIKTLYFEYC